MLNKSDPRLLTNPPLHSSQIEELSWADRYTTYGTLNFVNVDHQCYQPRYAGTTNAKQSYSQMFLFSYQEERPILNKSTGGKGKWRIRVCVCVCLKEAPKLSGSLVPLQSTTATSNLPLERELASKCLPIPIMWYIQILSWYMPHDWADRSLPCNHCRIKTGFVLLTIWWN